MNSYIPGKSRWGVVVIIVLQVAVCLGAATFAAIRHQQEEQAKSAIPQMIEAVKAAGWEPETSFYLQGLPAGYLVIPIFLLSEPQLIGSAPFGDCTTHFTAELDSPKNVTFTIKSGFKESTHLGNLTLTYKDLYEQRESLGLEECFKML
jgi:hypothetical protein